MVLNGKDRQEKRREEREGAKEGGKKRNEIQILINKKIDFKFWYIHTTNHSSENKWTTHKGES